MAEDYEQTKKKNQAYAPLVIAGGLALLLFGLVVFIPLAIAGAVILAIGLFVLFRDSVEGKFADFKESVGEKWPVDFLSKRKLGVWIFLMSEILDFRITYRCLRLCSIFQQFMACCYSSAQRDAWAD